VISEYRYTMSNKFWKRYLPDPTKIREIKALGFLGDKLYSPNLWYLNRQSVARAFAVGLWAMYTPPLPWQQVIAAVGAVYFNANLPIAVALVWITNPITWLPMYYLAYLIGSWALGTTTFTFDRFSELFAVDKALEFGAPLLIGCFILMNIGAVLGYFGVHLLWRRGVMHALELRKLRGKVYDTAFMANESYASYKRLLAQREKTKNKDAS